MAQHLTICADYSIDINMTTYNHYTLNPLSTPNPYIPLSKKLKNNYPNNC